MLLTVRYRVERVPRVSGSGYMVDVGVYLPPTAIMAAAPLARRGDGDFTYST